MLVVGGRGKQGVGDEHAGSGWRSEGIVFSFDVGGMQIMSHPTLIFHVPRNLLLFGAYQDKGD